MSHGLAAMAPSGFLSRLTKCAESQDLRLEPLDVRKEAEWPAICAGA
jgi:hypothetical protein